METFNEALQAGLAHHRAGRLYDAERMYHRVLELYPRHARAVHLLGLIGFQVGQHEKALELMNRAITLDGFNAVFHADLAEIYKALGRTDEAIAACQKALSLNPEMASAHNCLGELQLARGQTDAAQESFRSALELDPKLAAAHANLGTLLRMTGHIDRAQAECELAVQLAPDNPHHYVGLGMALFDQGKLLDAIACHQRALKLKPGLVKAQFQTALARLALGDYDKGFREFESRHAFDELVRHRFALPMWTPGDWSVRRVLVHAETRLGDTLQFVRYVPLLEARDIEVHLNVQEELIPLLTHSGYRRLQSGEAAPEGCQAQIPIMSLPRVMGTTLDTVPAQVPYLSVPAELVAKWRAKLAAHEGFKVGINWQGGRAYHNDCLRSIPLGQFAPLAAVPGVQLFSLQKKEGTEQLAAIATQFEVHDLGPELDESAGAFVDTAAVIKNLDLVVTSDTSIAHLAGGLAAPVWVALASAADWRWLQTRGDSPWYPSMRLFRQHELGKWEELFRRVAGELATLASSRGAK